MQAKNNLLPLEKRKLKVEGDCTARHVAAIDKSWVCDRLFPRFVAPHKDELPMGAQEAYLELLHQIFSDLSWLLNLQYHRFWSQIIYSKSSIICLTSFLQEAPPGYSLYNLPQIIEQNLSKIYEVVFMLFSRLSTARESQEHFITPKALGDILYDNYIFTVPTFFDLCSIYGVSNKEGVELILKNVVSIQPKYFKDISSAEPHLIAILEKTVNIFSSDSKTSEGLKDLIIHVYDSLVTSRIFLEVFSRGYEVYGTPQFVSSIASFYSLVIPDLAKNTKIKEWCDNLRIECIRTIRSVLENVISSAIESKSMEDIEKYLNLVSEIMSEDLFICDYHSIHPLNLDFDLIIQLNPDIDMLKIDYLLEALASHVEIKLKKLDKNKIPETQITNYPSSSSQVDDKRQVSGIQLMSLISQVQDLLPHLGDAFVEACLKYYDYSAENVVSAVLDSTLPSHLEESNWESNLANSSTNAVDIEGASSLDLEFPTAYKPKKRREHRNLNQLLSDKRDIKEMKDKFANLGFIEDEYDDEYDDTYDDQDVNVREPDEVDKRRAFVVPRVLRTAEPEEEDDDEEPDIVQLPNNGVKRDIFVQNPEEMRAKAEQRRATARAQRDVVGRAKGQGQDKQVLVNREKKNVHKSTSGNHNRRDRASRKRNQGMIPS